jgi:hypothetical protein
MQTLARSDLDSLTGRNRLTACFWTIESLSSLARSRCQDLLDSRFTAESAALFRPSGW